MPNPRPKVGSGRDMEQRWVRGKVGKIDEIIINRKLNMD